ncbi:aminotransferase-like domain-containing protein [Cupriavidus sp. USMAA2-4]|uniref:aminotransferase-like domain-containing protein n=1 Tax=Cupriavidus sp. USMAA2-4 TaxID=876364 RepID=UPI000A5D8EDD|nr:PLP-dependent aminotransferase family protein [Cupriavidus sp. USMAA2-4]
MQETEGTGGSQDVAAPGAPPPAWIGGFVRGAGPRYQQIVDAIERAVADGGLRVGDRLPAQRRLADWLQVDLTTVTRAYAEAKRRHLLEARGAMGSYVTAPKVELEGLVDLGMNIPPPPAGLDLEDMLKRGLAQVLLRADADLLMTYHLGGGGQADRQAGALWLAPMFGSVDARRVVVCPGAQAALAALVLALSAPGDVILAEPLIYPGVRAAAEQFGRRLVAVECDAEGMLPDALERACRTHGARLLYLNPTQQNPTTATLSAARRRALAETAARLDLRIIEDDPYWRFAAAAPPPLAQFAPQRVYYISTLSKCLSPGLRTAFVLLPDGVGEDGFLAALRSFALMSTPLTTALVTQWIHDGSADALHQGVREEARLRLGLAGQVLGGAPGGLDGGASGIHVWYPLPSYWTPADLAHAARAEGLAVTPAGAFQAGGAAASAIRISLGGVRDRAALGAALKKLSALLARRPQGAQEIVV